MAKPTEIKPWRVVALVVIVLGAIFAGLEVYFYFADTKDQRTSRFDAEKQRCAEKGAKLYIVTDQKKSFLASKADAIGPDDPRYRAALQTALTPHTYAAFICDGEFYDQNM